MLESYVERWPTARIENFRYMSRSGMMGWLSVMMDTTSSNTEQRSAAKEEFQLYKNELRPLIREANLYHISKRPDGVHWDGMEYFDILTRRGVVYAFHGSMENEAEHKFVLLGLNPRSRYQLQFHDHSAPTQIFEGTELMRGGITVHLPIPNSSEIVSLKELPAPND